MEHVLAYVLVTVVMVLVGQFNAKNSVERVRNLLLAMLVMAFCFVVVDTSIGQRIVHLLSGQ